MSFRVIQIAVLTTAMLVPLGCKSLYGQYQSSPRNDTIAGGVAGAIIGGIVGKQNDETPEGIAIGAALGALAGNVAGNARQDMEAQRRAYNEAAYRQQLVNQQVQQQAFQRSASVQDVISMTQNGIGSSVIMNHLQSVGVQQEIGVNEIITLHRAGVNEQVISLMQQMGSGQVAVQPTSAPVVVQPTPPVLVQPVAPTYVQPVIAPRPSIVIETYRPRPPVQYHYRSKPKSRHGSAPRGGVHYHHRF
ncbi:glycine zipper domain-containing protein [Mariniblastus fucicola]|uniref:Glycine zipper domain-containing protein n=1 Tax=Mariniblastus fucicola TaxID=980251 RepID=A0A5B9PB35_9BACT|nr:glycine zipper domain-containing protein [Mariniblastus fucicola]QEG22190.1 hypothetical protein MFFC18_20510 [Mariniblastus fucicola]